MSESDWVISTLNAPHMSESDCVISTVWRWWRSWHFKPFRMFPLFSDEWYSEYSAVCWTLDPHRVCILMQNKSVLIPAVSLEWGEDKALVLIFTRCGLWRSPGGRDRLHWEAGDSRKTRLKQTWSDILLGLPAWTYRSWSHWMSADVGAQICPIV